MAFRWIPGVMVVLSLFCGTKAGSVRPNKGEGTAPALMRADTTGDLGAGKIEPR